MKTQFDVIKQIPRKNNIIQFDSIMKLISQNIKKSPIKRNISYQELKINYKLLQIPKESEICNRLIILYDGEENLINAFKEQAAYFSEIENENQVVPYLYIAIPKYEKDLNHAQTQLIDLIESKNKIQEFTDKTTMVTLIRKEKSQ